MSYTKQAIDMENKLFIGTHQKVEINVVLQYVSEFCAAFGMRITYQDFKVFRVEGGMRRLNDDNFLNDHSHIEVFYKNNPTFITVTLFKNEIHPGYSVITEPFVTGVSIWIGGDSTCKSLSAMIAAAIAASINSKVCDSERLWSDQEMNTPNEFIEKVKAKIKLDAPTN